MKTDYQTKKLGEILDFKVVKNTKHLPYVGMEDIESGTGRLIGSREPRRMQSATAYFDTDCVLYGKLRPYLNKVFVPDFEGHCTTEFIPLRPDLKILTREWLALWLRSKAFVEEISRQTTGSRMPRADISYLKEMEIPLPPIGEQKKIVAKIEKQFANIDEAARLRAESQELTDQLPSAALHEIFSNSNVWEEVRIGDVCKINPSKSEIKDLSNDREISFVPMSAVDEYMQSIEVQEIRNLGQVKKGYTYFRKGDILFAKITPCMENGKVAYANNLECEIGFGSTEFHVLRADKVKINPRFLYHIVRSRVFREIAEKHMTGSAGQKRVPKEFLENYKISFPSLAEQNAIVKKLDALSEKVRALRALQAAQAADLKALKQSILREAFVNGR